MIVNNPPRLASHKGINKYVQSDLYSWLKNLVSGMNGRLSFQDNFPSFVVNDLTIPAGSSVDIDNLLVNIIPNERIIVRQTGNGVVTDGVWDLKTLRLFNNGAVDVVVSVRFFYVFENGVLGG